MTLLLSVAICAILLAGGIGLGVRYNIRHERAARRWRDGGR